MKLPRIPLLICLFLLLFLPGLEQSSLAHAQSLYFEELFDDPTLPEWQHTDQAYVQDGVLVLHQGGFAHHPENWVNFSFSFRAEFSGQGELIIPNQAFYFLGSGTAMPAKSLITLTKSLSEGTIILA